MRERRRGQGPSVELWTGQFIKTVFRAQLNAKGVQAGVCFAADLSGACGQVILCQILEAFRCLFTSLGT